MTSDDDSVEEVIEVPQRQPERTNGVEESDFVESIKDVSYEVMTLPMIHGKKQKFKSDLKANKTINKYLDDQLNIQLLRSVNKHVRFGVVYSYLYWKNFMEL